MDIFASREQKVRVRIQTVMDGLELAEALAFDPAIHIAQQLLKNIYALEVVDETRVLRLALLQEVVLVKNGFQGDVLLVQERVDCGRIMEAESASRLGEDSSADGEQAQYLQNMQRHLDYRAHRSRIVRSQSSSNTV